MRLAAVLALVVLAACGVPSEDRPELVPTEEIPATTGTQRPADQAPTAQGSRTVGIYLLRDNRLALVHRTLPRTADVEQIVNQLAEGPTPAEAADGFRTTVLPGPIGVRLVGSTADITVTTALTQLAGDDQLQAFAQIVWTVTERSMVRRVSVSANVDPIRVPTDMGLVSRPVTRDDFSSVAPLGWESPSPD